MIKRGSMRTLGVAAAVTLALVACGDNPVDPGPNLLGPIPRNVEFAVSLAIDLDNMTETASGLFYRDDVVGNGDIAATGDAATVGYVLWLTDGTSLGSGVFPFVLGTVGQGGAIAGFDEGVTGMRVGGERTLVLPATLAYGSGGTAGIPGDAVLVYELALTALVKAQP